MREEPRKVMRTGYVRYHGGYYRVPDRFIGSRVWAILSGDVLRIECGRATIGWYRVKTDDSKIFPRHSSESEESDKPDLKVPFHSRAR